MTDDAGKPTELGNHYQISDLAPLSSPTPSKAVQVTLGWGIKIIFRKQNSIYKGIFYSDFFTKSYTWWKVRGQKKYEEGGRKSESFQNRERSRGRGLQRIKVNKLCFDHISALPMIICSAMQPRVRRPSKAWGEWKRGKDEESNFGSISNSVRFWSR